MTTRTLPLLVLSVFGIFGIKTCGFNFSVDYLRYYKREDFDQRYIIIYIYIYIGIRVQVSGLSGYTVYTGITGPSRRLYTPPSLPGVYS